MYINNIPKISPKDIITIIHLRINTHTITTLKHFSKQQIIIKLLFLKYTKHIF